MLKMYRLLTGIEYLPVPLELMDAFFELQGPPDPDLGFDVNAWLSKRRFESWQ
jgi:hypothetical protein